MRLLDNDNGTADSLKLKQAIYDLHQSLDGIHLEVMRKGVNERISLRSVCIKSRQLQRRTHERNRQEFKVEVRPGGAIEITVRSKSTGKVRFCYTQGQYDPDEVYAVPSFTDNLSETQRNTLRQFYNECNPRPMSDLVHGGGQALIIGTMQFQCSPQDLLCGLVETIYAMRNALLHGEVEPDAKVLACYEPAYRIVMQFLTGVS